MPRRWWEQAEHCSFSRTVVLASSGLCSFPETMKQISDDNLNSNYVCWPPGSKPITLIPLSYFVEQNWPKSKQCRFHKLSGSENSPSFFLGLSIFTVTNVIQYFHSVECRDLRPRYCKRIMWQKCFQIRYGRRLQRACRKTCLQCWSGGRLSTHINTLQSEP